jgi:hypothetical protein
MLAAVDCVHLTGSRDSANNNHRWRLPTLVSLGARAAAEQLAPCGQPQAVAVLLRILRRVVCRDATCICGMTTIAPAA